MESNQGGVAICSAMYLGLIQDGYFDIFFCLRSLAGVFSNIFPPAGALFEEWLVNVAAMLPVRFRGTEALPALIFSLGGSLPVVLVGAFAPGRIATPREPHLFKFGLVRSTGWCNALVVDICRRSEPQGFSRALIQSSSNTIQIALIQNRQARPIWEILP